MGWGFGITGRRTTDEGICVMDKKDELDLTNLSMEVFELDLSELEVRSLTAGHGMSEHAASCGGGTVSSTCS